MSPTIQMIVNDLVFLAIGFVFGYALHDILKKSLSVDENMSKNLLLFTVTIIWAIGMIVSLVNPAYSVPVPVHAIFGAIVGFFFYRPKQ